MTKNDGANLDAETFDLDAWIDGDTRPEVTVTLYRHDAAYKAKLADIERRMTLAEKAEGDRGLDDETSATLLAELAEMQDERERTALRVRVRQLIDDEMIEVAKAAIQAGVKKADRDMVVLWQVAAACVEPTFTAEQLNRLRTRDRDGQAMYAQLYVALNSLQQGLPTPS